MNEEITKMSLLITHLDVSTETKEKLYTQNYKISTEIERLNNIIDGFEKPLITLQNRINTGMIEEEQNKFAIRYVKLKLKELKGSDE